MTTSTDSGSLLLVEHSRGNISILEICSKWPGGEGFVCHGLILTINHLLEFESAFEVISIGHFEFQLMTMFYYSILRLRLENSLHLCHSIHFQIFSHPVMVSLFLSQHNGLFPPSTLLIVIFWVIFQVSPLPMSVTTHSNCCLHTNYFSERSYCRHVPPLGSLLVDLSSAVAMTPLMATDLAVTPPPIPSLTGHHL